MQNIWILIPKKTNLKQQQLYQATELSAQTAAAVKKINRPQTGCLPLRHIVQIAACLCRLFKNGGVEPQYPRQLYCPQRF